MTCRTSPERACLAPADETVRFALSGVKRFPHATPETARRGLPRTAKSTN
jgi:hypothetical protein